MSKTIQRPLACRNVHCGAVCSPADAEDMCAIFGGKPYKCPNYERRDDLYRQTELLDKIKKAREEIDDLDRHFDNDYFSSNRDSMFKCSEVLEILDKLIESEE